MPAIICTSRLRLPAGGPNEFVNGLYPELLLYDPNGNLVAVAAGNASDGRNSVIDFTVPSGDAGNLDNRGGKLAEYIGNRPTASSGWWPLAPRGAFAVLTVTGTTPAAGALVQPPSDYHRQLQRADLLAFAHRRRARSQRRARPPASPMSTPPR